MARSTVRLGSTFGSRKPVSDSYSPAPEKPATSSAVDDERKRSPWLGANPEKRAASALRIPASQVASILTALTMDTTPPPPITLAIAGLLTSVPWYHFNQVAWALPG